MVVLCLSAAPDRCWRGDSCRARAAYVVSATAHKLAVRLALPVQLSDQMFLSLGQYWALTFRKNVCVTRSVPARARDEFITSALAATWREAIFPTRRINATGRSIGISPTS